MGVAFDVVVFALDDIGRVAVVAAAEQTSDKTEREPAKNRPAPARPENKNPSDQSVTKKTVIPKPSGIEAPAWVASMRNPSQPSAM